MNISSDRVSVQCFFLLSHVALPTIYDVVMELFDLVLNRRIFDLLLLDENDLMISKTCNSFPKQKYLFDYLTKNK